MPSYVCLIFDSADQALKVETFTRSNDREAFDAALDLYRSESTSRAYELWRDGRKIAVYRPKRPGSATDQLEPLRLIRDGAPE